MKNNKGFMMAEVIVVSAIVLILLASLFVSYNKIYGQYNTLTNYYDTVTLYRLQYYRNILIENDMINDLLTQADKSEIINIYNYKDKNGSVFALRENEQSEYIADRVFLIKANGSQIGANILDNQNNVNPTFKDYAKYLANSVKLNSNYVMIMERCMITDEGGTDKANIDDCKYAYLEVYDGYEK